MATFKDTVSNFSYYVSKLFYSFYRTSESKQIQDVNWNKSPRFLSCYSEAAKISAGAQI